MGREERFWEKVDRRGEDECWPWTGSKTGSGYGNLFSHRSGGRNHNVYAHRLAYEIESGPIPAGLLVMHSCDNPPCCNPAHLRLGTIGDNNRDRSSKGRGRENRQWGAANPNAKLSDGDVQLIRGFLQRGSTQKEVATMFDVSQPQISRIARGEQR